MIKKDDYSFNSLQKNEKLTGMLFIGPTILGLVAIILIPLLYSLVISFSDYNFIHPVISSFVGFQNFLKAFSDQYFWNSLWVTIEFVVVVVGLELLLGFMIAMLLNRDIKLKGLYYAILTIPMVMSPIAVSLIWKMLLHQELGIVNYVLSSFGIGSVNWLGSTHGTLLTLILVDIWHQISFMILVLLAGLVSLPLEPYQAAKIDGANALQILFKITIPLMKPVIATVVLIRTIMAFRTYDLVYIMTKGGPGVSTDVLSYFIYKKTFMSLDLAQASAISWVLLLLVLLVVFGLFRYLESEETA
ncbi:MAG TPA: sugar ABC transporter permease [Firmicutes bacterium]|jgi:multiple sugar transport system permease protein|nr:sugar ABC transporter permease [Bacillota bacterium]